MDAFKPSLFNFRWDKYFQPGQISYSTVEVDNEFNIFSTYFLKEYI